MPLNPQLYAALLRVFSKVNISNSGVPMHARYETDHYGELHLRPLFSGEYYVVACPICCDHKQRLSINHRWGERDERTKKRILWLTCCHRNDCMHEWMNRKKLYDLVYGPFMQRPAAIRIEPVIENEPPLVPVKLPDGFQLLSDLPKGHLARRYINGRRFSPDALSQLWSIGFAPSEFDERGRLVIPFFGPQVTDDAVTPVKWTIVGHQSRALGDPIAGQPKYRTSRTPTSRILYGLEHINHLDSIIYVCEGTMDAWRLGPGAVAVLGKSISVEQCKLLRMMTPGRDIIIMLDADATEAAEFAAQKLRATLSIDLLSDRPPGRVCVAQLPLGKDPADCSKTEIAKATRDAIDNYRLTVTP